MATNYARRIHWYSPISYWNSLLLTWKAQSNKPTEMHTKSRCYSHGCMDYSPLVEWALFDFPTHSSFSLPVCYFLFILRCRCASMYYPDPWLIGAFHCNSMRDARVLFVVYGCYCFVFEKSRKLSNFSQHHLCITSYFGFSHKQHHITQFICLTQLGNTALATTFSVCTTIGR